jgi:hypothetical protein
LFSFTALKKVFAQNEEIQEMAQNDFIMLNLMVRELVVFLISKFNGKFECPLFSYFQNTPS